MTSPNEWNEGIHATAEAGWPNILTVLTILLHCFVRFVGAALVILLWYPVESANVVLIILLLLTCRLFWSCYVYALMIFLENLLLLFWLFSYYWFVGLVGTIYAYAPMLLL
jgi:hypothetical protein